MLSPARGNKYQVRPGRAMSDEDARRRYRCAEVLKARSLATRPGREEAQHTPTAFDREQEHAVHRLDRADILVAPTALLLQHKPLLSFHKTSMYYAFAINR